jgi:hypothetical protein
VVDGVIDRLGHDRGTYGPKRSGRTHSLLTAPLTGVIVGGLVGGAAAWLLGFLSILGAAYVPLVALGAGEGTLAGIVHLGLDSLTDHGIYVNGERRRLAGWRSDDPAVNGLVIMLSLVVMGVTLVTRLPWLLVIAESALLAEPILWVWVPLFTLGLVLAAVGAARSRSAVPMSRRTWSGRQHPQGKAPAAPVVCAKCGTVAMRDDRLFCNG